MTEPVAPRPETGGFKEGLEDIVATSSSICLVDGIKGRLLYRGYDIVELAEKSEFSEVAYLLWYGRLPSRPEYETFRALFRNSIELPEETVEILRLIPKAATPMEVLRTAVSSLGHWDPDSGNTAFDASLRKAIRLTTRIGAIITAHQSIREGRDPIRPKSGENVAFNFLYGLTGREPDPEFVRALDVSLILHADHELNASTFAARVTAATLSDMYSSVTSGIGTLKGPLHGGANEQVMRVLKEIGDPARAETYVRDALSRKVKLPGFGHRVYRTEDPRATVLRRWSERLGKHVGDSKWYEISREVERVVRQNTKVYPNVDFYSASTYHVMGIPTELFTPLFAVSRIVGWTAHILEQWSHNRLIRPRANYTGPIDLAYTPIDQRG
ncbi:MAG TPA: citrate/2-methylcitrate synthase [Planctomycetota bacterium]|nr:citrate/2-methylcitrate synthase [Planctomycetota bacterium]